MINNGHTSKYFNITRGVRQGGPLSSYLFIIAVEYLSIAIRGDDQIKGIKIGNEIIKVIQYADDTTIAVSDLDSAKRAMKMLDLFYKSSGLKMNTEKTEGLYLGNLKHEKTTPLGISWPHRPIKSLGIYHSYNVKDCIRANFEEKMEKLKKQLHWWKSRSLSLTGKILIVKTIACGQEERDHN